MPPSATGRRSLISPGTILLFLVNLSYMLGAFLADFNATHVYNPNWPPHAKFHNGQTMSLAILLSLASNTLLYQSTTATDQVVARDKLAWAAVIGSFYAGAGLMAIWFPGTAWVDPEFYIEGQVTQKGVFGGVVGVVLVGYLLERRRMEGGKVKA